MYKVKKKRVICPYCNYRMPIEYDANSSTNGVFIRCKGSHCKKEFELVIKDGVQYKRAWVYEKLTGMFKSLF